jgi:hypothetical protein
VFPNLKPISILALEDMQTESNVIQMLGLEDEVCPYLLCLELLEYLLDDLDNV